MSHADRLAAAGALAVVPRTVAALHGALKARIADVAAGFQLKTETEGQTRAPIMVGARLPPKAAGVNQFPFLIVRVQGGEDSAQSGDQNATAKIEIVVGTYSDEDDGWLDVLLLIDAIRDDLGAEPTIAGTGFEHTGPLVYVIPDDQPRPQWFGFITTNWTLPRPQRANAQED